MRDRGYEVKTVIHRARDLSEFPREEKPKGMTDEVFMAKMRKKHPGKTLAIYPDISKDRIHDPDRYSVGPVSERHFPPDSERPRETKNYEQYNPLFDDISVLRRD